jgi:phage baseplate assembly protein W
MSLVGNQTRKTYSFKSAGNNFADVEQDEVVVVNQKPPIGIKTPMELSMNSGLFTMHTDISKQISDNLRNLIMTNHGERLGFYDFGADLRPLVFELGQEEADILAVERIKTAVSKYMPFVSLSNFQVFVDRLDNKEVAKVAVQVTYKIPRLDKLTRSLEVMLYMGG